MYETNKGCKLYYDALNQNDAKPNCYLKLEDKHQKTYTVAVLFSSTVSSVHVPL